ncbi:DMT family transporter [Candidatus Gottesmanbacteria bacterium]|nr:DMT family transporter [Candidatus Gottesmanbacteria bacterium]
MKNRGIFLILLSALLYSIMPVLIRTLGGGGLPPVSQVFLRYIVAFLTAAFYFFRTSKNKIHIQKKDVALLLITTIFGYALSNLFYTYGMLNTYVSNALFLSFTFAIIAPILAHIFLKDKINVFNVAALATATVALVLLFQPNAIPTWKIGGAFAILSALGQAIYLVIRKKLKNYSASFLMLANTCVGVIILGFLSLIIERSFYFQGGIQRISANTWMTTVLFGIDNFLAWLVMTKGFEYVKAATGSILLLSELLFGISFAFLFFQEIPTFATLAGGVLILLSSLLVILKGEN